VTAVACPVTVVGDGRVAAAAASLAAAGHPVHHVANVRAVAAATTRCVVCPADRVRAVAGLRPAPAVVALLPGGSCDEALAALADGAHECVAVDDEPALLRAVAMAVARRAAADRARRDPLTGLADRALLHERLAAALASVRQGPGALAVLFVDLDGFKAVNDRHGHQTGDGVLVDVARRLQAAVRPRDIVARYGGDEFVIVCEQVDPDEAHAIANRLAARLAEPIGIDGARVPVGASIGVAITRDARVTPPRLVARADADMYRVKRRTSALEVAPR